MGTAIMAMLRLIVAVALVATVLSAPTGAPLSDAHTTTTKASCHCQGCVHPFWSSGTCELPSCGSMPDITAEQCKQKGEQNEAQGSNGNGTYSRKDCKFSLHDAKQPVNNWKEFRVGASTSTSKTVTMHDLASYRCPNTINKNNWNMVDAAGNNLQGHDSDQVFNVNVNGNDMTVSSNSAWANMDLRFECPHVSDHTVSGQTAGYCWLYDHMPTSHETTTSGVHDQYTCYSNTRETHAPTPPTPTPTPVPTPSPTPSPTEPPTPAPSPTPTENPTPSPTRNPTRSPTRSPTRVPTENPTTRPPSPSPSHTPTEVPTPSPTRSPSRSPTRSPTRVPTENPTPAPSRSPTEAPAASCSTKLGGATSSGGLSWAKVVNIEANNRNHITSSSITNKLSDADINSLRSAGTGKMWLTCGSTQAYLNQESRLFSSTASGSSMINTCSSSPSGTYSTAANHWSGHKSIDCWAMGIHIIYQHDNVNGCWSASDSHTTAGALYVECPTSNYQYSAYASNTCPSGCSAINDLQACKDAFPSTQTMYPAASAIGNSGTASGNYGTGRPGGCFLHNPNKHLHFNTNSVGGSSHGNDYKICSCGGAASYVDVGSGHCVDSSNRRPPHCYTQSITDENTCKSACTAVSGCSAYEWGQTGGYCQLIWTTGISSLNSAQHSDTTGSCSSSVLNNWKYNLNGDGGYSNGAIVQTYHNTGGRCYRKG